MQAGFYWALLLALSPMPTLAVAADEADGVTPYRPSVSSPAQLPLAGQLEMELGLLRSRSRSDAGRRDSVPTTLKLAFTPEWGVVLGGEALVAAPDGSGRARGAGDALLVLKRAWLVDAATAIGVELGSKLPTARSSIGSGRADYTLNGILSRDLGSVHLDLNLNLTRLGAVDPGSSRQQTGASAALSLPLVPQWGLNVEWSGSRRAAADSTAQGLLALTYSPSARLTIDAGLTRGLNRTTPDWAIFTGVVFPLARLW